MKFKLIITKEEESITLCVHKRTPLTDKIEELVNNNEISIEGININGYLEKDIVPLKLEEISRFYAEDDKCYASVDSKTYQIKKRLYQIEEILPSYFIRINESSIINIYFIKRFNTSWTANVFVELKDGVRVYISRRQLKIVKERLGI